jgi:hypothetical protein
VIDQYYYSAEFRSALEEARESARNSKYDVPFTVKKKEKEQSKDVQLRKC